MDDVLARILTWAEAEEAVRVVVLTSTRARAEGPPDALSDYDVILALDEPLGLRPGRSLRDACGTVGR
jgi:hypothetical protein